MGQFNRVMARISTFLLLLAAVFVQFNNFGVTECANEDYGEKNNVSKLMDLTVDEANKLLEKEKIYYYGQLIRFVEANVMTFDFWEGRLDVEIDENGKIVKIHGVSSG